MSWVWAWVLTIPIAALIAAVSYFIINAVHHMES
jgi:phosphate/sulfate permease